MVPVAVEKHMPFPKAIFSHYNRGQQQRRQVWRAIRYNFHNNTTTTIKAAAAAVVVVAAAAFAPFLCIQLFFL